MQDAISRLSNPSLKAGTSTAGRNSALVPCALKVLGLKPFPFTAQFIPHADGSPLGGASSASPAAARANCFEPLFHEVFSK